MATINLRVGNDALTFQELDDNFTNLNNDKAELSGCTFTGDVLLNSNTNANHLMVGRGTSAASQVLKMGVTDTTAVFNYIEDTTAEGVGAYGSYIFQLSGNEGSTPSINAFVINDDLATVLGTIKITTPLDLSSESTAVMIDSNNHLGYRELGTLAFSSATYDNYSSWTLQGDAGTNQTISSGNTVDIAGGTAISTATSATDTLTVTHADISRTDTTSTDAPAYGGTFEAVTSVTSDDRGHITAIDVSTITIPASDERDTNLSWTAGTTAGPTVNSSTGTDAVIPSASGSASGVVTTGTQTFAGNKTFNGSVTLNNTSLSGVNNLSFQDPGPNEGIGWAGGNFTIYESPNDLTTNTAGNLQFVSGGVRRVTFDTSGNVDVTGTLTAIAKSFDIEHPTKEGMRLRYGSLEGPENGVYVRGRTQENIIELPDYWTGLVDEDSITVHITAAGKSQNIWVKKIEDYRVHLRSIEAIDCFYTIYGERKDTDKLVVEYGT